MKQQGRGPGWQRKDLTRGSNYILSEKVHLNQLTDLAPPRPRWLSALAAFQWQEPCQGVCGKSRLCHRPGALASRWGLPGGLEAGQGTRRHSCGEEGLAFQDGAAWRLTKC